MIGSSRRAASDLEIFLREGSLSFASSRETTSNARGISPRILRKFAPTQLHQISSRPVLQLHVQRAQHGQQASQVVPGYLLPVEIFPVVPLPLLHDQYVVVIPPARENGQPPGRYPYRSQGGRGYGRGLDCQRSRYVRADESICRLLHARIDVIVLAARLLDRVVVRAAREARRLRNLIPIRRRARRRSQLGHRTRVALVVLDHRIPHATHHAGLGSKRACSLSRFGPSHVHEAERVYRHGSDGDTRLLGRRHTRFLGLIGRGRRRLDGLGFRLRLLRWGWRRRFLRQRSSVVLRAELLVGHHQDLAPSGIGNYPVAYPGRPLALTGMDIGSRPRLLGLNDLRIRWATDKQECHAPLSPTQT